MIGDKETLNMPEENQADFFGKQMENEQLSAI